MFNQRISSGLQVGALVLLAAASAPANADFNIAQYPLYVQQPVKPSFIMAVDDSGSMKFETLFPGRDGQGFWHRPSGSFFVADGSGGWRLRTQSDPSSLGGFHGLMPSVSSPLDVNRLAIPPLDSFGFARAPKYNSSWYDPEVTYRPWKRGDGTEYANSTPSDAREDPRNASPRFNLTTNTYDQIDDADNEYLTINEGGFPFAFSATNGSPVTLQTGWQVRNVENAVQTCATSAGDISLPASSNGTWLMITSTRTLANCATFHIQRQSAGRINHVNEMFTVPVGTTLPAGTEYYRFALRRLNADGDYNDVVGGRYESSLDPGNNNRVDSCGGLGADRMQRDTWVTLTTALTITDATYSGCRVGLRNYMPTFYLPADAPAPAGYNVATRVLAIDACGTGCNLNRYEIRSANYSSAAVYNAQMQNFANWYTFYGNRNRAMISGMTRALADVTFMRVGFFRINNRADVVMNDLEIQAARNNLFNNSLLNLPANGSTPNRQAVDHLGTQFMRAPAAANAVNPPEPFLNEADGGACQVNGGMLFTDGYSNQDGPAVGNLDQAMGAPFSDGNSDTLADITAKYYLNSLQPGFANQAGIRVSAACNGTPDPWVDCQEFPHMNFYGVTLGAKGNSFGVTHAIEPNDWTEGYSNPPAWPARENDQPSTVDDIWHGAINSRGRYINATSPERITQAMRDVLLEVSSRARPAGGVAASGSRTGDGFLVYVPEYFSDDWTGDLKAYRLTPSGALASPAVWSAASLLQPVAPGSRQIFASVGGSLVNFTTAGLGGATNAQSLLQIGAGDFTAYGAGVTVPDVIDYVRGDQSREVSNGGNLRNRRSKLGDILNSQPELTTAASFPYAQLSPAEGGGSTGPGSYGAYITAKRSRTPVLFVGANDGMLHAINSSATGGQILFSVIPNSVLPRLKELPKRTYSHRYFVDGSPNQADVRVGGAWATYLFSNNGAGGRSVMALDVTNAASGFSASNFKWEFQNAGLGNVMHAPRAALLEGGAWVALVGNGPNSDDHRARLFVLNAGTGAISQAVEVGAGSFADPNGLTSITPIDTDFNGKADTLYGGDLHGNVWKFNVEGNAVEVANGGNPLFIARDSAGARQPITGTVSAGLHHISGQLVVFGTGKYFEVGDNQAGPTSQVQSFYGLWDKNDSSSISGRGQLQQQTLGETTIDSRVFRTISDTPVDWQSQRGWFIDLTVGSAGNGERVLGRPRVLLGNVVFTTYLPQGDICNPGGVSRAYVVDLLTGAPDGNIAGGSCSNCGGAVIAVEGAPVASPPVAVRPPSDGAREGIDRPIQDRDGAGNLVNPTPAPGCRNDVGLILGEGYARLKEIDCGRQAWRQLQ